MKMLLVSIAVSAGLLATGAQAKSAAGATAICKDGSSSHATTEKGACSRHGGVKNWIGASQAASPTPMPVAMPKAAPAPMARTATPMARTSPMTSPMPGVSGVCKDGSNYYGESKRGACSGHGGVKNWFGKSAPMAPPPVAASAPAPMRAPAAAPLMNAPTPVATPMGTPAPRVARTPTAMPTQPAMGGGPGMVWVNTSSKVYHCSNDKWYGKTKRGEYMSEAGARAKGFRAEHGKACM